MVADVIDRIYEAATIPELWEGLLEDLSVEHGFEGGVLFTVNANAQRGVFSQGVRDVFDAFLRDGWASRSERARRTIAKNHAGFVRDEDLFSAEEAAVDPLHVELLRPFGLGDVAGSVIESPNGDLTALSFERALARGRTPDDAIQAFDALRPHIARAAVIAGRLELDRARTQVMTLSSIGLPGAVMSTTGRAIALNSEFEALSEQVEVRAHDLVAPRDPKSAALFAQALAGIIPGGRSIPLPRTETRRPQCSTCLPSAETHATCFRAPPGCWSRRPSAASPTCPQACSEGCSTSPPRKPRSRPR
ncbi:hypothetical protein [Chenggangzhangella methanolivorans]|uniref:LuxR family transcriptional regulator n=1 Tax=Chenggangzhangella methanolivorans TaxID=1437009 RepID=A0A9E6R5P4_9HYPH|nr:hypothetical protein [Chenggangzhangella methanolivorans]QZN98657.1 hypothetical protein K6K41_16770 [Chenggangzhangella methanolivorans]